METCSKDVVARGLRPARWRASIGGVLFLALATCPAACESDSDPGEEDVVAGTDPVRARIGAAGGALAAPTGHVLEGFRVDIPAGALATDTDLTLVATVDPTPLGLLAQRVGPQVRVTPEDVTPGQPVRITVPVDLVMLQPWGRTPADCAVWQRTETGWTKLAQVGSSESTVTVETSSFATLAAGIALTPKSICLDNPDLCSPLCLAGTYCIDRLPDPTKAMLEGTEQATSVANGVAYYLHVPAANQLTIARYNLSTGATTTFQPLASSSLTTTPLTVRGEIAVEADGSALVATSIGNLRFRPSGQPEIYEPNTGGIGVAVIGTTTTRFFTKNVLVKTAMQSRLCAAPSNTCAAIPDRRKGIEVKGRPGAVLASASARKFVYLDKSAGAFAFSGLSLLVTPTFFKPPLEASILYQATSLATSAETARLAIGGISMSVEGSLGSAADVFTDAAGSAWQGAAGLGTSAVTTSVAVANGDRVYAVSGEVPEVVARAANGTTVHVALTDAAPGTSGFTEMLPRVIRRIPGTGSDAFLVTRGLAPGAHEFYRVSPR